MSEMAWLSLTDLGFRRAGRTIVEPVTLSLPLSGRTIILGPNGAGKSTLLQLVHGMLRASSGSVRVLDLKRVTREVQPGELALVLQRPVMLARSVQANVEHALSVRGVASAERAALAEQALERVGLANFSERHAPKLSGGEQQRLAIARVIAGAPRCLLLDEPAASLDPGATAAVERLLGSLNEAGLGIIMSTHDLGQARRLADQVVFMHRGQVLEVSPSGSFFRAPQTDTARQFLEGALLD
jgi:tungstate transport system ATP-binding protein